MSIECGSLGYACARLQARHGQRISEGGWRGIEALRGLAPALDCARNSSLRPWLVGITAESSAGQIEDRLRLHWRAGVDELAGWLPSGWHASVQCWALVPDLSVLQHVLRGGRPPRWMHLDDRLGPLCSGDERALAQAWSAAPWAGLASARRSPGELGQAWWADWRRCLPAALGRDTGLQQLSALLREHFIRFGNLLPAQAWPARTALGARLLALLRRATTEPAAPFVHLALRALDLERLRAELLVRRLFVRVQVP